MIDNNILTTKSIEVIQNIQDVSQQVQDELESTTVFTPHMNKTTIESVMKKRIQYQLEK